VKHKHNTTLSPEHVTWLRTFAEAKGGISQAANFLGLSRNALTRAMASLPVHRGTSALLAQQIAERESTVAQTP
jgi:DNA-binding phage protein